MCYQAQRWTLVSPACAGGGGEGRAVTPALLDPRVQSLNIWFPSCSAQVRVKGLDIGGG